MCSENSGDWASNKRARSANKALVAMEEMMRMGVEVGVVMGWIQQGVFFCSPNYTASYAEF
jgi:hypothetical protein